MITYIDFNAWLEGYNKLKTMISINALDDNSIKSVATTLIYTPVSNMSVEDKIAYEEKIGELRGIVDSLAETTGTPGRN